MKTNSFERTSVLQPRWIILVALASALGCLSKPSPDIANRICSTDQQCPIGYSCLAPGKPGGCCKPGTVVCPVPMAIDGASLDTSAIDLGMAHDTLIDTGNSDGNGTPTGDASLEIDQSNDATNGSVDVSNPGDSGGTVDTNAHDAPLPVPDLAAEGPTPDGPGTCSTDKDCPIQAPLCLGYKCAKCAADTDCVGRTGPACAPSGLCVACTANTHCKGAAATCNTTTNQCVGCVTRADCSGACQTCISGVCTAVKNLDDPGVCPGTCDSTGACKAKQGQTCQTAADCAAGLPCADGYCCNSACGGSCQACNVATSLGTCTTLAANAQPHSGHPPCTATDPGCGGSCLGSATCTYPASACGAASCTASGSYQAAGTCSNGLCTVPTPQACASGKYCTGGACVTLVADGGTCQSGGQCANGNCSNSTCCATGLTGCSGACVSLSTSNTNCGSCGRSCATGSTCSGGSCYLNDGQSCTTSSQCLTGTCSTFYVDGDGDHYGTNAFVQRCGTTVPTGYADKSGDCCDSDINAHPGQTTPYPTPDGCGSYDYNCDGHESAVPYGPVQGSCTPNCYIAAVDDCRDWNGDCIYYEVPACGLSITEHQMQCHYLDVGTGPPKCWVGEVIIRLPGDGQSCY
jgi:hypothetical protein